MSLTRLALATRQFSNEHQHIKFDKAEPSKMTTKNKLPSARSHESKTNKNKLRQLVRKHGMLRLHTYAAT